MDGNMVPATATIAAVIVGSTLLLVVRSTLRALLGTNGTVKLKDKHCLVTGGSSGIGKALAKRMIQEGAHVTIAARRQDTLDAAVEEIKKCLIFPEQRIQAVSVDVSDADAVDRVMTKVIADHGAVEILANCAGFAIAKEFDQMSTGEIERIIRVNTLGTAFVTRALLPGMKAAGGGRILFTSSICGQMGFYGYGAYSASKFALVGMAQALQMEVKAHGIGVSVAYPPDTDTPGYARESVGKPRVTHLIEEGAGMYSPDQVAEKMLRGLKAGDFSITVGFEGFFVGLGTAGFAPCFSALDAAMQVIGSGIFRATTFALNRRFYGIAARAKRKQEI